MKSILIVTAVLLLVFSCRKQQPEMNAAQNACDCIEETTAEFTIEEMTAQQGQPWNFYTISDTIFAGHNVRFTAKANDVTYKWYIGNEVLSSKTVFRNFPLSTLAQNIPITLVVKKEVNKICFPNDDGYDSVVKILHPADFVIDTGTDYEFPFLEGTYRVKSSHLPDSFDVGFYISKDFQTTAMFNVINYNGLGSNCIETAEVYGFNYRQIWSQDGTFNSPLGCDYLQGDIHRRIDGVTEMNFSLHPPGSPNYTLLKYLGRKL
jgi:hypothetical protein